MISLLRNLDFNIETTILEFNENLLKRMEEIGMSREELAEALGKKPGYVTRLLRGNITWNLKNMSRVALAVGCRLEINLIEV